MTDRAETYEHYLSVCKSHKKDINKLIVAIFEDNSQYGRDEKSKNLKDILNLRGNNYFHKNLKLTNDDAFILYHTLKINSCITELDLRFNRINDEGASWISKLLIENGTIRKCNLMGNDIGPDGGEQLAAALQVNLALLFQQKIAVIQGTSAGLHRKNQNIIYLNMNGNRIGNRGGMAMAQMLQVNITLQHLDLGDTDQKIESLIALATILNYNRTLASINVNRPVPQYQFANWMDEIAQHFAIMLKNNTGLVELHMQKYEMRDYGAQWFSEKLAHNRKLVHLDLSCNRITRDGAKYLADFLKLDTPLRVLDLGHNRLEDDGAKYIAEALMFSNTTLQKISFKHNNIHWEGLCAISDALNYNSTLTHLYVWGNNFEEPACIAFKNLIEKGRINKTSTDVRAYMVDNQAFVCEVSNGINMYYYWQPTFGLSTTES